MKKSSCFHVFLGLTLLFFLLFPATAESQTGSLIVTLEPQAARSAGAQWKLRDVTLDWRNSGDILIDIPTGNHIITFRDVDGWEKPVDQVVTIADGETTELTFEYIQLPQTGSLQVNIGPEEAVGAGAQWRRSGTNLWLGSGFIETDLQVGTHIVEFRDINDWITPNRRSVIISDGEITTISATYLQLSGGLRVFINPPAVRDAGAQWRRFGTDTWFNSGDTEIDIPAGDHLVEFRDIAGWAKPSIQVVTILGDRIIDKEVSYTQGGDLQVILEPSAARAAGAGWKLAGVIPDNDEGWHTADITTIAGIRPGVHTIEFRAIPGWMKPEDQTITIRAGRTTFITGRYILSTEEGFLRVFIEPSSAANLGARWRRVGTDIWLHSGETERGFPEGTFTIEFKPIPGWATPGNKAVSIHRGQPPASLVGVYTSPQTRVRVMNWLETVYPHLLPVSGMEVTVRDDWYIRYYPETDTYLGSPGDRLYYYAPSVKDKVRDLGDIEDWLPMARDAGF